jgi:GxxExxY protein
MNTSNAPLKPKILFPELSHTIMSIAFEIHNQLGPGFSEDIYEKAFVYELAERGIAYEEQRVVKVEYKGKPLGVYRLDLVVDGKIIVELKAVFQMNDLFKQQLLSYLKATKMELGILINFGSQKVESVRVANTKGFVSLPKLPDRK